MFSLTANRTFVAAFGLAGLCLLSACVSSPTDALRLSPEALPSSETGVRKTGAFPKIGQVPEGQTTQMTEQEKAEIKRSFGTLTPNDGVEAAKKAEADYKRELSRMQQLLAEQQRKRAAQDDY